MGSVPRLVFVIDNDFIFKMHGNEVMTSVDEVKWDSIKGLVNLLIEMAAVLGISLNSRVILQLHHDGLARGAIEILCGSENFSQVVDLSKNLLSSVLSDSQFLKQPDMFNDVIGKYEEHSQEVIDLIDGFLEKNGGKLLKSTGTLFANEESILEIRGRIVPYNIDDCATQKIVLTGTLEGVSRCRREAEVLVVASDDENIAINKIIRIGIDVEEYIQVLRNRVGNDETYQFLVEKKFNAREKLVIELTDFVERHD
jgi:predicted RND superfamily exporter protein